MSESPEEVDDGDYILVPDGTAHPNDYAVRLLRLPEFADLVDGEAAIDWLLKRDEKIRGGRQILGTVHMPRVPGELNPCFKWMLARIFGRLPDFLIILDKRYWYASTPRLREILVYHELTHCMHKVDGSGEKRYDMDERPMWGLRGHDVEEFTAVVRRYGAWNNEIDVFCAAVTAHATSERISAGASSGD